MLASLLTLLVDISRVDRMSRRKSASSISGSVRAQPPRSEKARRSQQLKSDSGDEIIVEAIFSAHSDGLIVILCPSF